MIPLLFVSLVSSSMALANDESVASTCVRAKVRESYGQGWSVRTTTKADLAQGQREIYQLTMQAGNSYKILACGDHAFRNVDILVYDSEGNVVGSEPGVDREPMVELTPAATGIYYVAVFANGMNSTDGRGTVATAVIFK